MQDLLATYYGWLGQVWSILGSVFQGTAIKDSSLYWPGAAILGTATASVLGTWAILVNENKEATFVYVVCACMLSAIIGCAWPFIFAAVWGMAYILPGLTTLSIFFSGIYFFAQHRRTKIKKARIARNIERKKEREQNKRLEPYIREVNRFLAEDK